MHSLSILSLSFGIARAGVLSRRDNVISQSTRDPTYNLCLGKANTLTTVNPGVTYWMSGGSTHNFQGNVNNYGTIIASQTDHLKTNPYAGGQTANCIGSDSQNGNLVNNAGALISLNDYGSASAPTYDWYLHTMQNKGSIQFCGRGDTGGSTYQLYCDLDCYNYGLIDFEQYNNNNMGASFTWRNDVIGSNAANNIYNYGAFRLVNVVHHNVQNVYGDGCWVIDEGGVLYLEDGTGVFQNPTNGPSFPSQKIYFTDSSQPAGRLQTIHMDTAVYSKNCDFGPQVYNFGSGKAIEFYEIIKSSGGFSYANGILTITFTSNNKVNIKLGAGYDATKFYVAKNSQNYNKAGYNAIFYSGNAPTQTIPGQCQVSLPKCGNPETTVSSTSSVISSTRLTSSSTTTTLPLTSTTSTTTRPSSTTSSSMTQPTTSSNSPVSSSSSTRVSSSSTSIISSSSTQVTSSSSVRVTSSSSTSIVSSSSVPVTSSSNPIISSSSTSVISSSSIQVTSSSSAPVVSSSVTKTSSSSSVPISSSSTTQVTTSSIVSVTSVVSITTSSSSSGFPLSSSSILTTSSSTIPASVSSSTQITSSSVSIAPTMSSSAISSSSALVSSSSSNPIPSTTQSSLTTSAIATGVCAGGAGPDSTYTTSNGDVYGICKNTDFSGGDLTSVGSIVSPQACSDVCSQTAGCVAGSLVRGGQVCYLKSSRNPATSNSGVDSIYKISSGSTASNSASATSMNSVSSASIVTASTAQQSSTAQQTSIAPTSSSAPLTTSTSSSTSTSSTGVLTTTSSTVTGICAGGANPASTYTATNGDVYGVCLNTDFGGNDITSIGNIVSSEACAEACSKTTSCVAGSLVRGGQVCYLKSAKSIASANSGVDSVYKISSGSNGSTTVSASNTSPSVSVSTTTSAILTTALSSSSTISSSAALPSGSGVCAGGVGPVSTYTAKNGDLYGICLNTDFYGGDLTAVGSIPDDSSCAEICSQTPTCVAGTLHAGSQTCYLKSVRNAASSSNGEDSVYKISSGQGTSTNSGSASTTSVSSSLTTSSIFTTTSVSSTPVTSSVSSIAAASSSGPCANGAEPSSTYTASNGDVYGVCLNTDFSGGDLTSVNNIPDTSSCAEKCSQTSGCIAGSLVRGGQTCYLKSTLNPANANSGVDSVYKISSGSGGSASTSKTTAAVITSSAPNTSSTLPATTAASTCACGQTVTVTVTATPTA